MNSFIIIQTLNLRFIKKNQNITVQKNKPRIKNLIKNIKIIFQVKNPQVNISFFDNILLLINPIKLRIFHFLTIQNCQDETFGSGP